MKARDIKSVDDAERFVEGCLNDFESGVATKGETMQHFARYTGRLLEMASIKAKMKLQKILEEFIKENHG